MKTYLSFWRKSAAALILAGGVCFLGQAAEPANPQPLAGGGTNLIARISQRLALSESQKTQVEPILRESFAQRQAVLEKYRGQRSLRALRSLKRELEPIRRQTDQKLKGILTEAQMKELEKARAEMKDEVREKIRENRKQSR